MTANIDAQFNLRKRHPTGRLYFLLNKVQSAIAHRTLRCDLDVAYGDSSGQRVDIFPAREADSPVFVFIHGGYFRALDKSNYRFIARLTSQLGMTCVLVNYDLVPRVCVSDIVAQVQRSIRWIGEHIHEWNGDARRLTLCGHSVGAFLVAKVLEQEFISYTGASVEKALLLSGLFDLGSMRDSYLNKDLNLTADDVATLSPINFYLWQRPELLIAVGENETDEFVRQSTDYSEKLHADDIEHKCLVIPGINHYTMARMLARRGNVISDWLG